MRTAATAIFGPTSCSCTASAGPMRWSLSASGPTRSSGCDPWTASPIPFRGGDALSGPGLSCFAPSPGEAGSRPLRASIPIAGARPASRRFAGRQVARSPQGRVSAWTGCAMARMGSGATVRRRARQGPVTGPCRPARRSPGAADRRPRRAPPVLPCFGMKGDHRFGRGVEGRDSPRAVARVASLGNLAAIVECEPSSPRLRHFGESAKSDVRDSTADSDTLHPRLRNPPVRHG